MVLGGAGGFGFRELEVVVGVAVVEGTAEDVVAGRVVDTEGTDGGCATGALPQPAKPTETTARTGMFRRMEQ
ncbi:hypothetical protein [Amycolatopsis sp. MEPSY49]|uniref:hypothetical protein n=1 Tax=Amycolatopsis sp. MEPSY49 TaxID=3151600 RepID=UPI003EF1D82D